MRIRLQAGAGAPPGRARMRSAQVQALAHHGGGNRYAVLSAQAQDLLERVPPGMHGEVERAVVYGQQPLAADIP